MFEPVENFYKSVSEPQLMAIAGSKISNSPENNTLAVSFMRLKLRRERKEDYRSVGESEARVG